MNSPALHFLCRATFEQRHLCREAKVYLPRSVEQLHGNVHVHSNFPFQLNVILNLIQYQIHWICRMSYKMNENEQRSQSRHIQVDIKEKISSTDKLHVILI